MDIFRAQQAVDDFRRGLGSFGRRLDRSPELDELLDRAERNGWTAERIGQFIAGRMPAGSQPGLAIVTLRTLSARTEPAAPTDHQLAALARRQSRIFRQPLAPCGDCDGSPARWLDVTPKGHTGQRRVIHCPACWTRPPGYLSPAARAGPLDVPAGDG